MLKHEYFTQVLNEEQHERAAVNEYNFDHPEAFDYGLLIQTLKILKEGKRVEVNHMIPELSFQTKENSDQNVVNGLYYTTL